MWQNEPYKPTKNLKPSTLCQLHDNTVHLLYHQRPTQHTDNMNLKQVLFSFIYAVCMKLLDFVQNHWISWHWCISSIIQIVLTMFSQVSCIDYEAVIWNKYNVESSWQITYDIYNSKLSTIPFLCLLFGLYYHFHSEVMTAEMLIFRSTAIHGI